MGKDVCMYKDTQNNKLIDESGCIYPANTRGLKPVEPEEPNSLQIKYNKNYKASATNMERNKNFITTAVVFCSAVDSRSEALLRAKALYSGPPCSLMRVYGEIG
jgi:hypothetical protein